MTKKQFNKVMNAAPQCSSKAWDKLNLFPRSQPRCRSYYSHLPSRPQSGR